MKHVLTLLGGLLLAPAAAIRAAGIGDRVTKEELHVRDIAMWQ